MKDLRSKTVTEGNSASAARSLWLASGLKKDDFGKPLIAIANSFTEFVPGHVHLQEVGRLINRTIWENGAVAREFNTIAVDDGIAMGHDGMLYSLPSRDLIADSVEYMCNAHCVDALICISNCDKITPGMLMAGLRLNIPFVLVSGGPMEAGRILKGKSFRRTDPIEAYVSAMTPNYNQTDAMEIEAEACPTCGSCAGMFTANSMNCLAEAIGLALPGNGSLLATHVGRKRLFVDAGKKIVSIARKYYLGKDTSVLPRNIATKPAFENAMKVDIAMGGSTNTILHLLAMAQEADVAFDMNDMDKISRQIPHICKLSPANQDYYMEDVHRAGGIMGILGELDRGSLIDTSVNTIAGENLKKVLAKWDHLNSKDESIASFYKAAPGGKRTIAPYSQNMLWKDLDLDRESGCVRNLEFAYSKEGGLAILFGNIAPNGCVVKTAAVPGQMLKFSGKAIVFDDQDTALVAIDGGKIKHGSVIVIRYEGPKGGPGMQEMLKPTMSMKAQGIEQTCAIITDGRYSGGSAGLAIGHISPEAAEKGNIGIIENRDIIEIDISNRQINLLQSKEEIEKRRRKKDNWLPSVNRTRLITKALRSYAAFASSADKGGYRDVP